MKRLKNILQSKSIYYFGILVIIFHIIIFTKVIRYTSIYNNDVNIIEGEIIKYSLTEDKLSFILKSTDGEKISGTYYYREEECMDYFQIGTIVKLIGKLKDPSANAIPNTFNYQRYLYSNKIYKTIAVEQIEVIKENKNWLKRIKNSIYQKTDRNEYIKMFIIGDKSLLDGGVYNSFKNTGVAHLLAVSGMHVSVFVTVLDFLLKRLEMIKRKLLICIFLFFYAYIVSFSASILRVVIFYFLKFVSNLLDLHLDNKKTLFWTAFLMLLVNPFFIYQVGFIYSFVTVASLFLTQKYLQKKYLRDLLIISFWALLFTLPITVSLNYEINLLLFISNLLLIPFVTFILYPLALLCFMFSFLLPIFVTLTNILEMIIIFLDNIKFFIVIIPKLNWISIIIYYVLLLFLVYYNLKIYFFLLIGFILGVKLIGQFDPKYYVYYMDVGQGDSSIIVSPYQKNVAMIDTGGIFSYNQKTTYNVSNNVILYLKSIGIGRIDQLIITHGDYDHMGEAINLVENFKVEKVIFNCSEFNELEQELIKFLDKKKIPYYSCIKELNIYDNKLYFFNNKDYGNENDNSNVIYTELNNHKFLFMGDAGVEVEEDLIQKYNLQDIDVLKVGHHGSKTSSSKNFINEINPKYSIISVGKNNRYGHPNKEVLNNLNNSKIYRTDEDGSIMFNIMNNKLKIETCSP